MPALRRAGVDQLFRSEAGRRVPAAFARVGRDQGLGPPQPVLLPDAPESREARRLRPRAAVFAAARARPATGALRQRRRKDPVHVPVGTRQADGARAHVRGHHPEPRAPLSRDRFADGARGARQVPELEAVPRMRRHAAAARSAPRESRRSARTRERSSRFRACRSRTRRTISAASRSTGKSTRSPRRSSRRS